MSNLGARPHSAEKPRGDLMGKQDGLNGFGALEWSSAVGTVGWTGEGLEGTA